MKGKVTWVVDRKKMDEEEDARKGYRELGMRGEMREGRGGEDIYQVQGSNTRPPAADTHPHLPRRRAASFAYSSYHLASLREGKFGSTVVLTKIHQRILNGRLPVSGRELGDR